MQHAFPRLPASLLTCDVQHPRVLVGVADGDPLIVGDDVGVDGLDGLGVRLHPPHLPASHTTVIKWTTREDWFCMCVSHDQ